MAFHCNMVVIHRFSIPQTKLAIVLRLPKDLFFCLNCGLDIITMNCKCKIYIDHIQIYRFDTCSVRVKQ